MFLIYQGNALEAPFGAPKGITATAGLRAAEVLSDELIGILIFQLPKII